MSTKVDITMLAIWMFNFLAKLFTYVLFHYQRYIKTYISSHVSVCVIEL